MVSYKAYESPFFSSCDIWVGSSYKVKNPLSNEVKLKNGGRSSIENCRTPSKPGILEYELEK